MVIKKRGLGRGLDALLGEQVTATKRPGTSESLQQLPIEFLQPGRYQPRKAMDDSSLQELADSIANRGVMQPIIVRPIAKNRFEIIAGERRWRASQLAALQEVPVIVRDVDDSSAIAMSLIENIQREDLNPMEEARALQRLANEFKLTHQEVAEAVSKSRSTVTNYLRLNALDAEVAEMLEIGRLEMGHARALLTLGSEDQKHIGRQISDKQLSVRQAENLIRSLGRGKKDNKRTESSDKDVDRLANGLAEHLGQPVVIKQGAKGKGQLVITYNTLDELEGLLGHIGYSTERS